MSPGMKRTGDAPSAFNVISVSAEPADPDPGADEVGRLDKITREPQRHADPTLEVADADDARAAGALEERLRRVG